MAQDNKQLEQSDSSRQQELAALLDAVEIKDKQASKIIDKLTCGAIAVLILLIISIVLLPAIGSTRGKGSRSMANNTQLRGIHQAMVTYSNDNKYYLPGLQSDGSFYTAGYQGSVYSSSDTDINDTDNMNHSIYAEMLDGGFFTPEYIKNPVDACPDVVDSSVNNGEVNNCHYSYALLAFTNNQDLSSGETELTDLSAEWTQTLNTRAIVMSDRFITDGNSFSSSWTDKGSNTWRGVITRNDNSTNSEVMRHKEESFGELKYADGDAFKDFNANGVDHFSIFSLSGEADTTADTGKVYHGRMMP